MHHSRSNSGTEKSSLAASLQHIQTASHNQQTNRNVHIKKKKCNIRNSTIHYPKRCNLKQPKTRTRICTAFKNQNNQSRCSEQNLLFKHSDQQLKVDLGDLQSEKKNLSDFLHSHLKVGSFPSDEGLNLNAKDVSPQELERIVNKFVYHRNLNVTHWVALEKNIVKIKRFKHPKKTKRNKNAVSPSIITHGW